MSKIEFLRVKPGVTLLITCELSLPDASSSVVSWDPYDPNNKVGGRSYFLIRLFSLALDVMSEFQLSLRLDDSDAEEETMFSGGTSLLSWRRRLSTFKPSLLSVNERGRNPANAICSFIGVVISCWTLNLPLIFDSRCNITWLCWIEPSWKSSLIDVTSI